jgi:iron(III) transport system substrate-binding protein
MERPVGFAKTLRLALSLLLLAPFAACRRDSDAEATAGSTAPVEAAEVPVPSGPLTVYSGRSEELVGPLIERFERESGADVEVRYGETAELAATLLEEGTRTPAALFISQDAAALGALSRAGLLRELPMDLVQLVPAHFAASQQRHDWVGLSGRARTVVYNTTRLRPEALPQSLEALTEPAFRGRFGLAPGNASFQAQMAVYRVLKGEEALDRLLAGIHANQPKTYANNGAIVKAVAAGEIDFGLVNHYYLWRQLAEDPQTRAANFFMPGGDAGGFVNAAGAGVLSEDPRALDLVRFLLGDEAQKFFTEQTHEYPLAKGATTPEGLPPLAELRTPAVDFADVAAVLDETAKAVRRAGLVS